VNADKNKTKFTLMETRFHFNYFVMVYTDTFGCFNMHASYGKFIKSESVVIVLKKLKKKGKKWWQSMNFWMF